MIRSKGIIRPPFPTFANQDSPEKNPVAWFPITFGGSVRCRIRPTTTELALVNSANVKATEFGWGLDSFSANDTGARMTTPSHLTALNPVTMVSTFLKVGTSSNNTCIFEISHSNADVSPYIAYGIGFNGSAALRGEYNNAGTFFALDSSITPTNFVLNQVIFGLQNSEQKLYHNGVLIASSAGLWGGSSISGTSQLCIGINETNLTRNPNIITYDCRIYDRFLSASEAAEMWNNGNPWGFYSRTLSRHSYRQAITPLTVTGTNGEEYWFDGVPFVGLETLNDTGTEEFWFDGQTVISLFATTPPPTPTVTFPNLTLAA